MRPEPSQGGKGRYTISLVGPPLVTHTLTCKINNRKNMCQEGELIYTCAHNYYACNLHSIMCVCVCVCVCVYFIHTGIYIIYYSTHYVRYTSYHTLAMVLPCIENKEQRNQHSVWLFVYQTLFCWKTPSYTLQSLQKYIHKILQLQ